MKLIPIVGLGSPAAIEHDGHCGEILVDALQWPFIKRGQRDFIIEHELAHCQFDLEGEIEADRLGFDAFVEKGGDPWDAVAAIEDNLNMDDPRNQERAARLRERAAMPDYYNAYISDPASSGGYGADTGTQYPQTTESQSGGGWDADDWVNVIGSVIGGAPAVIAAINGRSVYTQPQGNYQQAPRRSSMTGWLIGGLLAVAAIGILVVIAKRGT